LKVRLSNRFSWQIHKRKGPNSWLGEKQLKSLPGFKVSITFCS
jgi:hypothetical protein